MITVLDGAGSGSGKACWVLMRGARADRFGCATRGEIVQLHQKLKCRGPKKPDRYWCAPSRTPGRTKNLVISGKAAGYVRSSELRRGCVVRSWRRRLDFVGLDADHSHT